MKYLMIVILFLAGCVNIPDKPMCVREAANVEHAERGYCDTTLDPDKHEAFYVDDVGHYYVDSKGNKYSWSQLKVISLVVPPETWASIASYIAKKCHNNPSSCGDSGVGQWGSSVMGELYDRTSANVNEVKNK